VTVTAELQQDWMEQFRIAHLCDEDLFREYQAGMASDKKNMWNTGRPISLEKIIQLENKFPELFFYP
jgi:hypothetical protein